MATKTFTTAQIRAAARVSFDTLAEARRAKRPGERLFKLDRTYTQPGRGLAVATEVFVVPQQNLDAL